MTEQDSTQITPAGSEGGDATQIASPSVNEGDETQMVAPVSHDGDETQIAAPVSHDGDTTQIVAAASHDGDTTQIAPAHAAPTSTQVDAVPVAVPAPGAESTTNPGIPAFLGKYKIEKILGQGAMGVVYKGTDPTIGRPVAIKTVLTSLLGLGQSSEIMARFKREAQAAGRINHPGIVSVYEFGEDGDTAFIAMEFVEGQELEELINSGHRLRIEDTVKMIDQLLDALGVAHEQGVVHRDIKPANLIVTKRGLKVADFGIANLETSSMTQMGEVLGTPNYMAPEQVYGQPVDGRTDLFSVGIILYQLLTGEKPFSGGSSATVMHRVVNNEPDAPSILNKLLPKGFDPIISKAMAKIPLERYQTAEEFQQALSGVLSGAAPAAGGTQANGTLIESTGPELDEKGVPKTLGKYTIEKVLGKGAMGIVYKGMDESIQRPVAIKTILTNLLDMDQSESILQRFKREAQAAGRINHPNIVAVYEYGKDGDTAFIAMEYVKGEELEDILESRKRLSIDDIKKLIGELLDALGVAHKNGVVHRDIKPANLILTENGIKVADFGIANLEDSSMTQMGEVLGTPNYMSPEQVYGQPVDGRSDLFSVGIILYQLLTGEKPFAGGAAATVMHRVVNADPEAPSILNQLIPKGFDKLVRKSLAKKPEDRFQTADDFKQALFIVCEKSAGGGGSEPIDGLWLKLALGFVLLAGIGVGVAQVMVPALLPWNTPDTIVGPVIEPPIKKQPIVPQPIVRQQVVEPPATLFGYITITTAEMEGAEIYFGGEKMGVTPFRKEMAVGSYEVKITKPGFYDFDGELDIEAGSDVQLLDMALQKM